MSEEYIRANRFGGGRRPAEGADKSEPTSDPTSATCVCRERSSPLVGYGRHASSTCGRHDRRRGRPPRICDRPVPNARAPLHPPPTTNRRPGGCGRRDDRCNDTNDTSDTAAHAVSGQVRHRQTTLARKRRATRTIEHADRQFSEHEKCDTLVCHCHYEETRRKQTCSE